MTQCRVPAGAGRQLLHRRAHGLGLGGVSRPHQQLERREGPVVAVRSAGSDRRGLLAVPRGETQVADRGRLCCRFVKIAGEAGVRATAAALRWASASSKATTAAARRWRARR